MPSEGEKTFRWLMLLTVGIVIIDQVIKILVKTHMYLGEDLEVTPWFYIKFIENPGMAMGMNFIPKLALTFGRIVAVILLIIGMRRLVRLDGLRTGFYVIVALITAGAAGNIFDCVFYGEVFNNPLPPAVAQAFSPEGGYAPWFEGRVVDMFYFPLFDFYWPDWMPIIGGQYFEFFSYIFNFADASICVGVILLLLFYRKDADVAFTYLFSKKEAEKLTKAGSDKDKK